MTEEPDILADSDGLWEALRAPCEQSELAGRLGEVSALAVAAAEALAALHWQDDPDRLLMWDGPIVDERDGTGARWRPGDALGIVRARVGEGALWDRDPGGRPMFCLPIVASIYAGADDLAVFDAAAPARIWTLRGDMTAQNEAEIVAGTGPLVLHPDLLAWARARGEGAVILDLKAWAPLLIELGRPIHCATFELGVEVQKALRRARPKLPAIGIVQPAKAAA